MAVCSRFHIHKALAIGIFVLIMRSFREYLNTSRLCQSYAKLRDFLSKFPVYSHGQNWFLCLRNYYASPVRTRDRTLRCCRRRWWRVYMCLRVYVRAYLDVVSKDVWDGIQRFERRCVRSWWKRLWWEGKSDGAEFHARKLHERKWREWRRRIQIRETRKFHFFPCQARCRFY